MASSGFLWFRIAGGEVDAVVERVRRLLFPEN